MLAHEQARDQEPADDEEDVDADEAARDGAESGVEQDDEEYRHTAQAFDVGPEVVVGAAWRGRGGQHEDRSDGRVCGRSRADRAHRVADCRHRCNVHMHETAIPPPVYGPT